MNVDLREDALSAYRIYEQILSIENDGIVTKIYAIKNVFADSAFRIKSRLHCSLTVSRMYLNHSDYKLIHIKEDDEDDVGEH